MGKLSVLRHIALGSASALALMVQSAAAAEVTYERLLNAEREPQNWLTNHRTYSGQRYSPLNAITKENVKNLKLAYAIPLAGTRGNEYLEATPLVDNGFMYTTDSSAWVYKIDVSNGEYGRILWHMDPGQQQPGANRGVALLGNLVVSVSNSPSRAIATNVDTGEVVWETNVQDQVAITQSAAPLAVKDKVVIGHGGGDNGVRGWIQLLNVKDGKLAWKKYTVPAPGEPGAETWKDDHNAWQTGGGATWMTGTHDPESNTLVWGTGQPAPDLDPTYRPGDNLYTASVVAWDVDSGKMNWYFQHTPNDRWDFDSVGTQMLLDGVINGETRRIVGHAARNGFYYVLDRNNGQFVLANGYLEKINWTAGIDPKTGRPLDYNPAGGVQVYAGVASPNAQEPLKLVCPGISGGNNFFPASFSARTRLAYVPALRGCQTTKIDFNMHTREKGFRGGEWAVAERNESDMVAVDPFTGQVKGRRAFPWPNYSGALATAGGVVFTGTMDGTFRAMDDNTLEDLWKINLGVGFTAPPMSYSVNGKQYILISSGLSGPAKGKLVKTPEMAEQRNATVMWVFSL
jgi:alcohol dehydrogenase (cytochrome c)